MLRFGLPTVPAEVSVFALFFVDRLWLYRFESPDDAGLYSLSVKLAGRRRLHGARVPVRLAAAGLLDRVDDAEAARVYARITTYYVLFTGRGRRRPGAARAAGWCGCSPRRSSSRAHEALPWVALGWALYGLFLVLVAMAGPRAGHGPQRARRALRAGGQRRAAGAARPAAGDRGRRARAGRRLRRDAGRDVGADPQPVPGRVRVGPAGAASSRVAGGIAAAGELLLPTDGVAGFVTRAARAGGDPARALRRALLPARASCSPPAGCSGGRVSTAG